ncbi:MAG: hypothetical protein OYH77_06265, partial [Pseudomonadota bacterium]|nr:hypothetical protein [Pseudomonadota bacterium]
PNLILIAILLAIISGGGFVLLGKISVNKNMERAMRAYNDDRDYQRALTIIESQPKLVAELLTRSKDSPYWLPLLRTLTFYGNAHISPADLPHIKGNDAINTPDDCSTTSWSQIWTASSTRWDEFLAQQKLIDTHWAMLLSWDWHWIHNHQSPGWQEPKSYAQACLRSAYDSFTSVLLPEDKQHLTAIIQARITWLAHALSSPERPPSVPIPNEPHPLLIWGCMEQSNHLNDLNNCMNPIKHLPQTELISYTHEKFIWNKLRIMRATGEEPNDDVSYTDSYNSIDYSSVIKFTSK